MSSADDPTGIDVEAVTAWMTEHVGTAAPLTFTRLAGGHSNLTYQVTDATGRDVVVRRPPMGELLPTAHDMGREYKIIHALQDTPVPVAESLGFSAEADVTGADFYVMGYVEGVVMHAAAQAEEAYDEQQRRTAGESFIDVLAALHEVDPDEVGLDDLGRKEGYLARQLKRWGGQYQASKTRERPDMDEVTSWLIAHTPEQGPARVVHGDYRLGNCLTGPDGSVLAVLDWEIATLGDPLADVGYVLATWPEPGERTPAAGGATAPSTLPGFPTRAELISRYEAASDTDLSGIDYYTAFSAWKSAAIAEGVYARYLAGQLSTEGLDLDMWPLAVSAYVDMAGEAITRLET